MQNPAKQYLKNKILTASKEDLMLMLIDGAIKFSTQAKGEMEKKDYYKMNELLIKAQRIVLELVMAMDRNSMEPEIYKNISGLYMFVYNKLINANLQKDAKQVDEALEILNSMRSMWQEAIDKLKQSAKSVVKQEILNPQQDKK